MIRAHASSLVLTLLRFIEKDNEALAGDLAEEWRAGRSTGWLCRQLLRSAALTALSRHASRVNAARLTLPYSDAVPFRLIDPATMNLRGHRVANVGGGGLLGVVFVLTIVVPQAWFLLLAGLTGGLVLGVATIVWRRDRGLAGPRDSAPLSLFHSAEVADRVAAPRMNTPRAILLVRV